MNTMTDEDYYNLTSQDRFGKRKLDDHTYSSEHKPPKGNDAYPSDNVDEFKGYVRCTLKRGIVMIDCEDNYLNNLMKKILTDQTDEKISAKWDKDIFIKSFMKIFGQLPDAKRNDADCKHDAAEYIFWFFNYSASNREMRLFLNDPQTFLSRFIPDDIYAHVALIISNCDSHQSHFYWESYYQNEFNNVTKLLNIPSDNDESNNKGAMSTKSSDDSNDIDESELDASELSNE